MRADAQKAGDGERMQMWAGQGAAMARTEPAGELVARVWAEARRLMP
jgi:nitronate monooxygenase